METVQSKRAKKVLIVTGDTLGEHMAGPAIRAFEMAKALTGVCEVKLASTVPVTLLHADFEIFRAVGSEFRKAVAWSDIIVFQGALLSTHPWLAKTEKIIVADLYDPMHLELLEQAKSVESGRRYLESLDLTSVMNEQIVRADFMLCASEKQRDFWLGQMAAVGRLNPANYDADSSLRNLIDVVPFGVQNDQPIQLNNGIRGTIPGISQRDKVILWGGGIYNWFDPLTLINAISRLSQRHQDIRLVFMGTQHPNPHVPEMKMSFEARQLSDDLDLTNKFVFFNEGWVPFERRSDFLLDADLGVSTHLEHLETAFSFRTRILDYLWAGLPIVATEGDTFETIIDQNGLGRTVPPSDVDALEIALENLLYEPKKLSIAAKNSRIYAEKMRWTQTLKPLLAFIDNPYRAADSTTRFAKDLKKLGYVGRRTLRQRLFMFIRSSQHVGFGVSVGQVCTNAIRKINQKFHNR